MKLIILEGIPTSGKTVLGEKITDFLKTNLDKDRSEVFYFNDDIRGKLGIDVLEILKNQDQSKMNAKEINLHLKSIIKKLSEIEKEDKKECIFILDRFHFSYLSNQTCRLSDFEDLEKMINDYTYYLLLNFKNYNAKKVFDRVKQSLSLRKGHGFQRHFDRLTTNESKGETPEERIGNHYLRRYEVYEKSFKDSKLKNKKKIEIDNIIKKDDYDKVLQDISEELLEFVLG